MIVLYLFALIALAVLHALVRFRVSRLEKRFARTAAEADSLLKASQSRGGNNRPDPYQSVKQQYELALLALKRDHSEARYGRWQAFSERFGASRRRLGGYRGRLLPYLCGLVDVAGVVLLAQRFDVGLTDVRSVLGL